jgi:hypothetical protein
VAPVAGSCSDAVAVPTRLALAPAQVGLRGGYVARHQESTARKSGIHPIASSRQPSLR